jgi:hypothetical protein
LALYVQVFIGGYMHREKSKTIPSTSPVPAKTMLGRPMPVMARRDPTGHMNPKVAADLRAQSQAHHGVNEGPAFLDGTTSEPLAEQLGSNYIRSALTGEETTEDARDGTTTEELGGPFIETSSATEMAYGVDRSNPIDATREPLPLT